jgi:hypothetical protein
MFNHAVRSTDTLTRGREMASITVFFVAFGVGCLTAVLIGLLSHARRAIDSTGKPLFWTWSAVTFCLVTICALTAQVYVDSPATFAASPAIALEP